jgi:hypothetical protein
VTVWGMSDSAVAASGLQGIHRAATIIWILAGALLFLYVMQKTGAMLRIKQGFFRITTDMRVQVVLVAFGFVMGHPEWSREKECTVVVMDLCFPIMPGEEGISLTAVEQFIIDLKDIGNIPIISVTADSFNSRQTIQNLKRANIETEILSVDDSLNPYQELLSAMITESVKVGKNVFLKNNISCLERKRTDRGKEKIDHPRGITHHQYYGDWEKSKCGINEKDVSDTLASVVYKILSSKIQPVTIYEDENNKHYSDSNEYSMGAVKAMYKRLNRPM